MRQNVGRFKIVDIGKAKDEDAAEVVITPEFVLDALDVWAPKGGLSLGTQTLGRYEVISAPADE